MLPVMAGTDDMATSKYDDLKTIGRHICFGNHKLPETTAIWNCGAAHDCPSRPLGLCQAGKRCYALNTERYCMNALPYRRRQQQIMRTVPAHRIAEGILRRCKGRKRTVKLFRFGQSGDFFDQQDVETLVVICRHLSENGIGCYGFTARTDLDLSPLLNVSNIGVSNSKGGWLKRGANWFRMVRHSSGKNWVCAEDCTICDTCSRVRGKVIEHPRVWWSDQMTFNEVVEYHEEWE